MEPGAPPGFRSPSAKNTGQKDSPLELSTCNLTPVFRAIDPSLLIAAASCLGWGGRSGLWQLLVLNLPGQLPEHLFQKQAGEEDILGGGGGKRSLGKRREVHILEME